MAEVGGGVEEMGSLEGRKVVVFAVVKAPS